MYVCIYNMYIHIHIYLRAYTYMMPKVWGKKEGMLLMKLGGQGCRSSVRELAGNSL